jgi:ATP phosphoribosyltransferase regulatory subunit
MTTPANDHWVLPEGVEELLPGEAGRLEAVRRRVLDVFDGWGYDLVMPPMVEFLESLLTGLGQDLDLETFKVTDQLTGRLMGVRADMTPQVARIEAHYLRRRGPVRLCYLGPVLHTRSRSLGGSREPIQLGAELFGHAGPESDAEIVGLMLEALSVAGVRGAHVDLGHVGVYRELVAAQALPEPVEAALYAALRRKSRPDVDEALAAADLAESVRRRFAALSELNGDPSVLARARDILGGVSAGVDAALGNLEAIVERCAQRLPGCPLCVDLAELRGYRYHTGAVFAAYVPGQGQAVAAGGRYDNIGRSFGYARPATGFSADLRALVRLVAGGGVARPCVLAPGDHDEALLQAVARLRAAGERVVTALPGVVREQLTEGCDRRLSHRNGRWEVVPL